MRVSSDASGWMAQKQQAKRAYERGDYATALNCYQQALSSGVLTAQEQSLILSNIVACRLKLGGTSQAQAAIDDAQRCIDLNSNWAKGHLRMAEALIAAGGRSNEACNSLQTALRLDPGLASARQLLVRELRRDHRHASSSSSSFRSEDSRDRSLDDADTDAQTYHDLDDSATLSWVDRLRFSYGQALAWYRRQSETIQSIVHIIGVLLLLYIAFGGRFGLDSLLSSSSTTSKSYQGNYGRGNVYEQYRQAVANDNYRKAYDEFRQRGRMHDEQQPPPQTRQTYSDPYTTGSATNYGGYGGWRTSGTGFLSDPTTLLVAVGVAFMCHQVGINPLHALILMGRMGGRRHHYNGGFGWGGGGFGYRRNRPRGGWYFR